MAAQFDAKNFVDRGRRPSRGWSGVVLEPLTPANIENL